MSKKVRFIDGPRAGETAMVRDVNDSYIVIVPNPNASRYANPNEPVTLTSRTALYGARRIPTTGHIVHNVAGEAIFECIGES